jgi:hypothetical protein
MILVLPGDGVLLEILTTPYGIVMTIQAAGSRRIRVRLTGDLFTGAFTYRTRGLARIASSLNCDISNVLMIPKLPYITLIYS